MGLALGDAFGALVELGDEGLAEHEGEGAGQAADGAEEHGLHGDGGEAGMHHSEELRGEDASKEGDDATADDDAAGLRRGIEHDEAAADDEAADEREHEELQLEVVLHITARGAGEQQAAEGGGGGRDGENDGVEDVVQLLLHDYR